MEVHTSTTINDIYEQSNINYIQFSLFSIKVYVGMAFVLLFSEHNKTESREGIVQVGKHSSVISWQAPLGICVFVFVVLISR